MGKVTVQIDWYTKIVLTLIAILLAGLLAKPYIVSKPASARLSSCLESITSIVTIIANYLHCLASVIMGL